jgi:hypothetical protein
MLKVDEVWINPEHVATMTIKPALQDSRGDFKLVICLTGVDEPVEIYRQHVRALDAIIEYINNYEKYK